MANEPKPAPTISVTTPVNMTVQLVDGGSLSLYLPSIEGDRTAAIKAALKSVTDAL